MKCTSMESITFSNVEHHHIMTSVWDIFCLEDREDTSKNPVYAGKPAAVEELRHMIEFAFMDISSYLQLC